MHSGIKKITLLILGIFIALFFYNFFLESYSNEFKAGHLSKVNTVVLSIVDNLKNSGGLVKNKFGMPIREESYKEKYFTHQPPLSIICLYNFVMIFGKNNINLASILISISMLLAIYFFISKFTNPFTGFWCAFLTGIQPLVYEYSVFFTPDLSVILLNTLILIVLARDNPGDFFNKLLLIFLLILSMLTYWPGYFVCLYVFLYYFFFKNKMKWDKLTATLFFMPFVMFAIFLLHTKLLTGSFNGGNLLMTFLGRVTNTGEISELGYYSGWIPDYSNYFQFLVFFKNMIAGSLSGFYLASTCIFLILAVFNIFNARKLLRKEILIFLAGIYFVGFSYLLIFNSFTYYHDFSLLYIIPCFTVSAVLLIYLIFYGFKDIILGKLKIKSEANRDLIMNLGFNVLLAVLYLVKVI